MSKTFKYLTAIALVTLPATHANAGVGKVSSPFVDEGKLELEYTGARYRDEVRSKNNKQKHKAKFEYGITDNWMFGLGVVEERVATKGMKFQGYEPEVKRQFTDQSQNWWLSSALKFEYLLAEETGDADTGEFSVLLARQQGPVRIMSNIKFEREFGKNRGDGVSLASALQGVYQLNPYAAPGLEWHAEYGKLNQFSAHENQEHFLGPIVMGKLFKIGDDEMKYEAGYYWGLTKASADEAARVRLKYEIRF